MNLKKITISGLVAGLVSFLIGSVLYMNPLISGIYSKYGDWPGLRSMDYFGGLGNWLTLMLIGGLVSTIFLAILYSYAEKGINIKPNWKKGLLFGFLLWLVSTIPNSYYTWLMYSYPGILNTIEAINGLIGSIVAGMVLAIVYERLK